MQSSTGALIKLSAGIKTKLAVCDKGQLFQQQNLDFRVKLFSTYTFCHNKMFVFRQQWSPSKCCLPLWVVFNRLSSFKECLPSKVVFNQKLSSIKGPLQSKGAFHQKLCSIKSCLSSKVVFHQRLSFIKGRLPVK